MKILAFIHTWAPDGEFDNYMVELIIGFMVGQKAFSLVNAKYDQLRLQNPIYCSSLYYTDAST